MDPQKSANGTRHVSKSRFRIRPCAAGVHLFDRRTGLNVLVDEWMLPEPMWARAPRQVSIALTNSCNLACAYCYAPKDRDALDFAQVTEWLNELDAHQCLGVGFGGGEPTLYREFARLCEYAMHSTELAVTFTTHAHQLTATLATELVGNVSFIRVSMDGIGPTYETLRGRSFKNFCPGLEYARSIAPYGINFVVNSQTLQDLDKAAEFAAQMGAVQLLLLPERPTTNSIGIDCASMEALRGWIKNYNCPIPLAIGEDSSDGLPTCKPLVNEFGLNAFAHISARGEIKRNSFERTGVLIGDEGVISALESLKSLPS